MVFRSGALLALLITIAGHSHSNHLPAVGEDDAGDHQRRADRDVRQVGRLLPAHRRSRTARSYSVMACPLPAQRSNESSLGPPRRWPISRCAAGRRRSSPAVAEDEVPSLVRQPVVTRSLQRL